MRAYIQQTYSVRGLARMMQSDRHNLFQYTYSCDCCCAESACMYLVMANASHMVIRLLDLDSLMLLHLLGWNTRPHAHFCSHSGHLGVWHSLFGSDLPAQDAVVCEEASTCLNAVWQVVHKQQER